MSVFDGKTGVSQAETDLRTDRRLPPAKSLSWDLITSRRSLAGTEGQFCELIHGDFRETVERSHFHHVRRNYITKVDGDQRETIVEHLYQNIFGAHTVVNHTVRNETRLGRYTKTWGQAFYAEDNQGQWQDAPSHTEQFDYSESHHDHDSLITGLAYGTNVVSAQFVVAQLGISGVVLSASGVKGEIEAAHSEYRGAYAECHPKPLESKQWNAPPLAIIKCKE